MSTLYMNNGRFLVGKVVAEADLKTSIQRAIDLIGGLDKVIFNGDKVTIKPNLNTADPYPASSDPAFIKALGEVILEAGASKIQIMDSSTMRTSSRGVAQKIGLDVVAEDLDADLIFLDEHDWVKVKFPRGKYLKSGSIGKPVLDIQKLVLAPNLKTHFFAGFTGSMKLFVGWIKHSQRIRMHARKLQQKVVDLASYFNPDLIVMDARTCFVTGGPSSGTCSTPGIILASGDMVATDVEGVKIIQSSKAENKVKMNVWDIPQIKRAVEIGFGATSDEDIEVVE
ncbi:MAG: DUF362 domain-containing protein [Candidatus Thorarchaeota archaeon]|nr:MAG: DUF362 domain-containing protein [Candidatus Thorarchaeota archaeon]